LGITVETTDCPFCELVAGQDTEFVPQEHVVWRDARTAAFVSPKWWPGNPGHVIVVPNEHYENLYEISDDALAAVGSTAKRVACAMKDEFGCDGTSTRQHNDAGAGQEVWHFHMHVFPRYVGDRLYEDDRAARWPPLDERAPYADRLRRALA
jgi:histidine triad (HIT) family protein